MKTRGQRNHREEHRGELWRHRASVLGISAVILLLVAVVSVSSMSLRAKNHAYIAQEAELAEQIEAEEARSEELTELEAYVGTDEYIEQTAKDKLGLVHENEIIFKRK